MGAKSKNIINACWTTRAIVKLLKKCGYLSWVAPAPCLRHAIACDCCCCSGAHWSWADQQAQGGCQHERSQDSVCRHQLSRRADTDGCPAVTQRFRCRRLQAGRNHQSQQSARAQPLPASSSVHVQEDRDRHRHQTKVWHSSAAQGQHWQPIRDPFKLTSPTQHALRRVISFRNFLA